MKRKFICFSSQNAMPDSVFLPGVKADEGFDIAAVERLAASLRSEGIDLLSCRGYGAQIDSVKALALSLRYAGPLSDIYRRKVDPYSACDVEIELDPGCRGDELLPRCQFYIPEHRFFRAVELPRCRISERVANDIPGTQRPDALLICLVKLVELSMHRKVSQGVRTCAAALVSLALRSDPQDSISISRDGARFIAAVQQTYRAESPLSYLAGILAAKTDSHQLSQCWLKVLQLVSPERAEPLLEKGEQWRIERLSLAEDVEKVMREKVSASSVLYTLEC